MRDNDIPFYHEDVPDGFSLFCTQNEYIQILSYIKSEIYKKQLETKKQREEEEQILKSEPEPIRKEFLCQICKSRFDNYLEHIKSNLHKKNKSKFLNAFNRIKETFKRIVDNNCHIKEGQKDNTNNININDNINIETTKEESFSFNENNKINNLKEKSKNLEIISEKKNVEIKENNDDDISMKEILNILNTIKDKDNLINKNNKIIIPVKRKKNDKNKYFLTGDNIHDLKQITKKISYFNDLFKNNK